MTDNAPGNHKDAVTTYDGDGRTQAKHVPEQNAGTATVYEYNPVWGQASILRFSLM